MHSCLTYDCQPVAAPGGQPQQPMRIAIVGTDGLPARYGGFETCVEQLAPRLASLGHTVDVLGSSVGRTVRAQDHDRLRHHYLPLRANGMVSVPYDLIGFLQSVGRSDAVVLLGVSAGVFMPLMRAIAGQRPVIVNVDGLESRRGKWQGFQRSFLGWSEALAVRHASHVVSDNQGIADAVMQQYGRTTTVIPYGNDHVVHLVPAAAQALVRKQFGLEPCAYLLTVARIEPENQIAEMMEAFQTSSQPRYVVVGNFGATALGRELLARYRDEPRILCIDSLFDPQALAALRSCCSLYLHGHSVGGTNPSLIEVLPYRRPILAYDCVFNRHTLRDGGAYFADQQQLAQLLQVPDVREWVPVAAELYAGCYRWDNIARAYESLCRMSHL